MRYTIGPKHLKFKSEPFWIDEPGLPPDRDLSDAVAIRETWLFPPSKARVAVSEQFYAVEGPQGSFWQKHEQRFFVADTVRLAHAYFGGGSRSGSLRELLRAFVDENAGVLAHRSLGRPRKTSRVFDRYEEPWGCFEDQSFTAAVVVDVTLGFAAGEVREAYTEFAQWLLPAVCMRVAVPTLSPAESAKMLANDVYERALKSDNFLVDHVANSLWSLGSGKSGTEHWWQIAGALVLAIDPGAIAEDLRPELAHAAREYVRSFFGLKPLHFCERWACVTWGGQVYPRRGAALPPGAWGALAPLAAYATAELLMLLTSPHAPASREAPTLGQQVALYKLARASARNGFGNANDTPRRAAGYAGVLSSEGADAWRASVMAMCASRGLELPGADVMAMHAPGAPAGALARAAAPAPPAPPAPSSTRFAVLPLPLPIPIALRASPASSASTLPLKKRKRRSRCSRGS